MRLTRQSIKEKHPTYTDSQVNQYIRDWENEQPQTAQFSWTTVKRDTPGTQGPAYDDKSASELAYWQKNDPNFISEMQDLLRRRTVEQRKLGSNIHGEDPLYRAQMDYLRGHKRKIQASPQVISEPTQVFDQRLPAQHLTKNISSAESVKAGGANMNEILSYMDDGYPITRNRMAGVPSYTPPSYEDAPDYKKPYLRELPVYSPEIYNEAEVDALTQKRAAVGLRAARTGMRRVANKLYGSPNVVRLGIREALGGLSEAIDRTMSSANEAASNEYARKFSLKSAQNQAKYQSEVAQARDYNEAEKEASYKNYDSDMRDWAAKRDYGMDVAKTNYAGKMKEYDTENEYDMLDYKSKIGRENYAFQKAWDVYARNYA